MAEDKKELTPEQAREALIREKMQVGGMSRESAEMVIEHQREADEARAKADGKTKKKGE